MKKIILGICGLLFINTQINAQLPNINLKDVSGNSINVSKLSNNGNPIIISFWATWCKPCKEELDNIHEVYADWVEETNVKLIAISIDDARNSSKIKPLTNSKGWEYEIYHDSNSEFATQMGVKPIPHTFLLDGKKKIVWNHTGYTDGDEEDLYEKILEIIE